MAATPALIGAINNGRVQFVAADTTTKKTLVTAGASGTKVVSIGAATDETANRDVQLFRFVGGVSYLIGTVQVPLGAGNTNAVPSVDLMNAVAMPHLPTDNDGQHYLLLGAGEVLQVAMAATVTAAKTVHISAQGGDL